MYKVIGKDGNEYGPASAEEIRSWIAQGRLDGPSKARPEGAAEWSALSALPEFQEALAQRAALVMASPPAAPFPVQTSLLAVASLVLGVLGLFTFGVTAVVGLILGIVAIVCINKSQGRLSGSGLAIAGMCVSGVMILMLPIMAAMLVPALARAKSRAQGINCMNNVKQLNLALIMYASDHKDTYPPADQWCDLILPYTGGSAAVFHCPSDVASRCSYGLNTNIANKRISDLGLPAKTVLVFSSGNRWNQAGGRDQAAVHQHERNAVTVGFADGHSEVVKTERLGSLGW
jgi:hypothetical protein